MIIQVLKAASMKMVVFWVLASSRLVDVYRRFTGTCCHCQGDNGGNKQLFKEIEKSVVMRSEVPKAVKLSIVVFWDMTPCSSYQKTTIDEHNKV
jgi:hypothetical protein